MYKNVRDQLSPNSDITGGQTKDLHFTGEKSKEVKKRCLELC